MPALCFFFRRLPPASLMRGLLHKGRSLAMVDSSSGASFPTPHERHKPWYGELSRYHWFVLTVCTLGWVFDTMGQQLFNVVRKPAIAALLGTAADNPNVDWYGGIATSLMLIGWATGGIIFGILGDKIGRARTMVFTILIYSVLTGLSGLAQGIWDFILYRFLCGLGIGGQFSVGVALVAEYMPPRARPKSLGLLQAMANLGNITAALIAMGFGHLEKIGSIHVGWSWRWTLAIGALPAFLAIPVFRSLKEPETWKKALASGEKKQKAGSLEELFGNPRWRRNTIVGMILASTGVIGLWGIGFFSVDLNQTVFRKIYEAGERKAGQALEDREFIAQVVAHPAAASTFITELQPKYFLSGEAGGKDVQQIYAAIIDLNSEKQEITRENVFAKVEKLFPLSAAQAQERRDRMTTYLTPPGTTPNYDFQKNVARITARVKKLNGEVSYWAAITSVLFNIGGFIGAYGFSYITGWIGRRWAFVVSFVMAGISTCIAFLYMNDAFDVVWMTPLMGGSIFLIFGGYAVYFPELYPTHLRSTGTSFCYNIGRYVAAIGPIGLGWLSSVIFRESSEPMRYAGAAMCAIFLVGLLALPFAPETKGQPLPE
jgi:MFS family permease